MADLPLHTGTQQRSSARALRVSAHGSISHSIDPVELLIDHNLSQPLDNTRVNAQDEWEQFASMMAS